MAGAGARLSMPESQLPVDEESAFPNCDAGVRDREHDLAYAVLSGQRAVTVTGNAGCGKTWLLRQVGPSLARNGVRLVHVNSPGRAPLDLRSIVDQVIQPSRPGADKDRVGRFFAALTQPKGGESQVTLVIDDADVLTPQAVNYLSLIASTSRAGSLPLQVVLAGRPQLWDLLSRQGGLGLRNMATHLELPDQATPLAERRRDLDKARHSDPALSGLWETLSGPGSGLAEAETAVSDPVLGAEVFSFDWAPLHSAVAGRARPRRWIAATSLLLVALSATALCAWLHFNPARAVAELAVKPGVASLWSRFVSAPEAAAADTEPPASSTPLTPSPVVSAGTAIATVELPAANPLPVTPAPAPAHDTGANQNAEPGQAQAAASPPAPPTTPALSNASTPGPVSEPPASTGAFAGHASAGRGQAGGRRKRGVRGKPTTVTRFGLPAGEADG